MGNRHEIESSLCLSFLAEILYLGSDGDYLKLGFETNTLAQAAELGPLCMSLTFAVFSVPF